MKSTSIDTVLEVRLRHEPGTLARVAAAIADHRGLLCEIVTIRVGDDHTQREITVETDTAEQVTRIIAALKTLPGAEVLSVRDRVMEAHRGGKIAVASRLELKTVRDLRTVYTPGVAQAVRAIQADPWTAADTTWRGRAVAILTDGSRVLGLGDVGPLAALPVMEGKAVLYDKFAGLSAVPLVLSVKSPSELVETAVRVSPGAALASDGRAINNALAFPSLVRAAIETRARTVPSPLDRALHDAVTDAVAQCAIATGMANTAAP